MKKTQVQSLIQEDPTSHLAPVPQLLSLSSRAWKLQHEKPKHRNERVDKAHAQQQRPSTATHRKYMTFLNFIYFLG